MSFSCRNITDNEVDLSPFSANASSKAPNAQLLLVWGGYSSDKSKIYWICIQNKSGGEDCHTRIHTDLNFKIHHKFSFILVAKNRKP